MSVSKVRIGGAPDFSDEVDRKGKLGAKATVDALAHRPLAFLAPDIVTAIIDGCTEPGLTLSRIKRLKLPASWQAQWKLLGFR